MSYLYELISQYGLISMFFIILLEYACFPVSSEIVLPFSGAIAYAAHIPFLVILAASVVAGILGTSICFAIGWFGGGAIIDAITTKFPSSQKGLDSSQAKFQKYGAFAVCIGRVIPLCRTYIAFVAGAAKQNVVTFLSSSFLGITLWNTVLIGLGYFLRSNWQIASDYYSKYKEFAIGVLAVLFIVIFFYKKSKSRVKKTNETIS